MRFTVTIELKPGHVATPRDLEATLAQLGELLSTTYRSLDNGTKWPQLLRDETGQRVGFWRFMN